MVRPHAPATEANDPLPSVAQVPPDTKFETALTELEQIVQDMESGRLSLEESISAYHRGAELLKHCQKQLSDAERKIQILENGELRDLDTSCEESR